MLRRALRRARRLSWADRREVVVTLATAVTIEIGLRTLRLPALARRLGVPFDATPGPAGTKPSERLPSWAARRVHLANRVMDRWPFGGTCLRRSLLVGSRLRRLRPSLRIGVRRDDAVRAHAWVEIAGAPVDTASSEFATLEEVGG